MGVSGDNNKWLLPFVALASAALALFRSDVMTAARYRPNDDGAASSESKGSGNGGAIPFDDVAMPKGNNIADEVDYRSRNGRTVIFNNGNAMPKHNNGINNGGHESKESRNDSTNISDDVAMPKENGTIDEVDYESKESRNSSTTVFNNSTMPKNDNSIDNVVYESKESKNDRTFVSDDIPVPKRSYGVNGTDYDYDDSNSNYSWEDETSSRWIPPGNRPHLTIDDLLGIFGGENTLVLGDSTGRQDYHTLYWLLRPPPPPTRANDDEGKKDDATSSPMSMGDWRRSMSLAYASDPDVGARIRGAINVGKGCCLEANETYCPGRIVPEPFRKYLLDVGWASTTTSPNENSAVGGTVAAAAANASIDQRQGDACSDSSRRGRPLPKRGKLDLANAKTMCFPKILQMARKNINLLRQYTVVALSAGIYPVVNCAACNVTKADPRRAYAPGDEVVELLAFLRDELSGPNRTVLWKVHGATAAAVADARAVSNGKGVGGYCYDGETDRRLVDAARSWFASERPPHMRLIDFRRAVRERSHGTARIKGDSPQHWGLEARLLGIDAMARALLDRRNENGQE